MHRVHRPLKRLLSSTRRSPTTTAGVSDIGTVRPWRPAYSAVPAHYSAMPWGASSMLGNRVGIAGILGHGGGSFMMSLQRRGRYQARGFFSSAQRFLSNLTPDDVVLGLIGANVAVFMLWRVADSSFMAKNFMISLDNFKSGRLHTLLTSAFSHADLDHIFSNMLGLYFFGKNIANLFGPQFLLQMYIAGALGGSVFFLVDKALFSRSGEVTNGAQGYLISDPSRTPGLGASAAVNAIILLDIFLFPTQMVYLNLIIPVPAFIMGALFIGTDLWRVAKGDSRVSGSAHLGGAAVAAFMFARIKGWIRF